jgi:hypothetical protein
MLSRSNSNAGDRIRRAKSTSSTHTASSGPRPVHAESDPFVTRQQAETAALEAYFRAQQRSNPECTEYRAMPRPKLERRRSRASGRTEGGHFEEARLGRRKSTLNRDDNAASKPARPRPLQQSQATNERNDDDRVIIRKRSVIPPNSSTTYNYFLPSSSPRLVRKSQTEYTDGSPIPRHSSALKERRSTLQPKTAHSEHTEVHRSNPSRRSYGVGQEHVAAPATKTPRGSFRETRTDEDVIAQARDRSSQNFQQKKLRERKSFILRPFQKRKSSSLQKSSSSGYDTSLPPFNYADEGILPPPPPPPAELHVPALTVQPEKKLRNFSESLKGRFKKVFRRTSRVPSELPAQHVEGKHFYFVANSPLSTSRIGNEKEEDPFIANYGSSQVRVPEPKPENASCRYSIAGQSTTNSRFTSWTNSTAAGTWSTRPDEEQNDSADECGRLKRSDSVSTLRKATSFLGRPIKNKLRKASRADLRSSEQSANLYTALQERINPSDSASQTPNDEQAAQSWTSSDLATLPSQQRPGSSISNTGRWQAPTIRSVTPDAIVSKSDPLSPVTEVLSPDTALQPSTGESKAKEQSDSTPRSRLQRRPAIKAPTPSKEQIARRIERSKNRWQSPLDELSPPAPRATRAAMDDNPYELRSLSRTLHQPVASNDLPHHAKVSEQSMEGRENLLSPSLYSRGTDGVSPRPNTPDEPGGTVITITGHEVRSYSISPKKPNATVAHPVRPSHEWRRWLSNELSGWNSITTPQELVLPLATLNNTEPQVLGVTPTFQQSNPEKAEGSADSSSRAPEATSLEPKTHRRKAKSRRPSFMNDRYPMLDTGRDSSDKTIKHASRISSRVGGLRLEGMESSSESSAVRDSEGEAGSSRPTSVLTTGRVVSKHQSMVQLHSTARRSAPSALATREDDGAEENTGSTNTVPQNAKNDAQSEADTATKVPSKPNSAFDLRVNYKNSASGRTKPLPVRRKPDANDHILIFEDNTIQNISAGPYASQVPAATPPAANKENTPPSEANGLPALSSSEWLAAGTIKKRDARKTSHVQPANMNRSVSRYSPSRAATPGSPAGGGNSPGQRLVTNWLDGKRSKENSPAFV